MRVRLFVVAILLCSRVFAGEPDSKNPARIDILSPDISPGEFSSVHHATAIQRYDRLPTPSERDRILASVPGLLDEIRSYDVMKRDRLFMGAAQVQTVSIADLERSFPEVSEAKLQALRSRFVAEGKP